MTETYLPVRDSIGYKNLKSGLMSVFQINLDEEKIKEFDFENFRYELNYKGSKVNIFIVSTQKNIQFQYGEGGELDISLPNPRYPEHSFLSETSLRFLVENEEQKSFLRFVSGENSSDVEEALKILKDYLDSK